MGSTTSMTQQKKGRKWKGRKEVEDGDKKKEEEKRLTLPKLRCLKEGAPRSGTQAFGEIAIPVWCCCL